MAKKIIEETRSKSEILYVPYEEAYGDGFEDMERRVPNIDLINEKKANALLPLYNSLWQKIVKLGTVTVSNPNLKNLKSQIADIEKQANDLGYKFVGNPTTKIGSRIVKK